MMCDSCDCSKCEQLSDEGKNGVEGAFGPPGKVHTRNAETSGTEF